MEEVRNEPDAAELTTDAPQARGWVVSESNQRIIYLVVGAILIGAVFRILQFSTESVCCGDFDGYYHIKWSQTLWEGIKSGHLPPTFKWLPLTTLNSKDYVDHHFLFHIIQIPFTWFGDLRLGAKIAALLFSSLAVFSCYWMIVHYKIRYAFVWLVALLACSAAFLYRMNMAKAPPLTIIFLVIGFYFLFERKHWLLAPLAFVFALTYDMVLLLDIAVIIWMAVIGWSELRIEWRPVVWTFIGTLAGFVINPYFPRNLRLFFEHFKMKVTASNFTTPVGGEWYPYTSWEFLGFCLVAFVAMVVGCLALNWSDKKRAARPLFLFLFSTLLFIITARSRRWVEYWPPFAVLFAAFSLKDVLDGVRSSAAALPESVMDELRPYIDQHGPLKIVERVKQRDFWRETETAVAGLLLSIPLIIAARYFYEHQGPPHFDIHFIKVIAAGIIFLACFVGYFIWRDAARMFTVFIVAALCFGAFFCVRFNVQDLRGNAKPEVYRKGMEWVAKNVPADQMIFNTDWDDFPKLFFYDTSHRYVSGLDPTYLLDQNPELSKLYDNITLGKEPDPGPIIRDRFGARYVFSDNEHEDFYNTALDSGWFDEIHLHTFARPDDRILSQDDLNYLKENMPQEFSGWTLTDGGRTLIVGTTGGDFAPDTTPAFQRFDIGVVDDCTILHIRDQKGPPPPDTNSVDTNENSDEGDEPANDNGN